MTIGCCIASCHCVCVWGGGPITGCSVKLSNCPTPLAEMLLYIIANGNNVDGSKRRGGINKTLCGFHDAFWARNSFHVIVL